MFKFRIAFLIALSLIFLGIGVQQFISTALFLKKSVAGEGQVIGYRTSIGKKGNKLYHPIIVFHENHRFYRHQASAGSSEPESRVGDRVRIFYDKNHPSDVRIDSFSELWFVGTLGMISWSFISLIIFLIFRFSYSKKKMENMKANAKIIEAKFTKVNEEKNINFCACYPYRVYAQSIDEEKNAVKTFKSALLWYDPSNFLKPDQQIKVYVDPKNAKKYYMDLSFLPGTFNA